MIVRILLIALLSFLVVRALRMMVRGLISGAIGVGPQTGARSGPQAPVTKLVRDPVCGTHVAPRTSLALVSGGTTHYFCSQECRDKYRSTL